MGVYATLGTNDMARSAVFCDAVLATIGWEAHMSFPMAEPIQGAAGRASCSGSATPTASATAWRFKHHDRLRRADPMRRSRPSTRRR